jgi:hypothetical protein
VAHSAKRNPDAHFGFDLDGKTYARLQDLPDAMNPEYIPVAYYVVA